MAGLSPAKGAAALIVAVFAFSSDSATAAVWNWGCTGSYGADKIVFNRERLVIVQSKAPLGKLDEIVQGGSSAIEALANRKDVTVRAAHQPDDVNAGFDKKLSFTAESDGKSKLVLTEISSRKTGETSKLLYGCRDEIKERFTKTYSLQIGSEPPRPITLSCMEYTLSTKGGRTCR